LFYFLAVKGSVLGIKICLTENGMGDEGGMDGSWGSATANVLADVVAVIAWPEDPILRRRLEGHQRSERGKGR